MSRFSFVFLVTELRCDPEIETGNLVTIFNDFYLDFVDDLLDVKWNASYAPFCRSKKCAQYMHVPERVSCSAVPPPGVERLCLCKENSKNITKNISCFL